MKKATVKKPQLDKPQLDKPQLDKSQPAPPAPPAPPSSTHDARPRFDHEAACAMEGATIARLIMLDGTEIDTMEGAAVIIAKALDEAYRHAGAFR